MRPSPSPGTTRRGLRRGVALGAAFLAACGCAQEPLSRAPATSRRPEPLSVESESRELPPRPEPSYWKWPAAPKAKGPAKPATVQLKVEEVAVPQPKRRAQGLIAFSIREEDAPAVPPAGKCSWLHLLWGRAPGQNLHLGQIDAVYDTKARRVRITIRAWSSRPGSGIGMDWGIDRPGARPYVGFRVSLKDLRRGDHAYKILEETRRETGAAKVRVLSSGKFTLGPAH